MGCYLEVARSVPMDENIKNAIWHQFGGAIDMLDDAFSACPYELWQVTV
jgi:hypothetical protein